jgi:lysophospholipase L1-like esterase
MTALRFPYDPANGLHVAGEEFGLPPAAAPPVDADELERLARFEHPAKLLAVADLPGAATLPVWAAAAAYGVEPAELAACRVALGERCAATARRLPAPALPVPAGGTVVALGDSITDDLLSWAELLRRRAGAGVTVVNAGVSGDTTADALRRLHAVAALSPDLVVTMLGTNDCQRHGPGQARLVSHDDTVRHLGAIAGWLGEAGARLAWITPPPVDEAALAAAVGERPFSLRDADVAAVAAAVRELPGTVVDAYALLRAPGALEEDGVHPSPHGQAMLAAALIDALGQNQSGAGTP